MINNLEIEKKVNILIKNCGDALQDVEDSENSAQYKRAVFQYNREVTKLMAFYDFLSDLIDTINANTECFDKEFDKIERAKKSQK